MIYIFYLEKREKYSHVEKLVNKSIVPLWSKSYQNAITTLQIKNITKYYIVKKSQSFKILEFIKLLIFKK